MHEIAWCDNLVKRHFIMQIFRRLILVLSTVLYPTPFWQTTIVTYTFAPEIQLDPEVWVFKLLLAGLNLRRLAYYIFIFQKRFLTIFISNYLYVQSWHIRIASKLVSADFLLKEQSSLYCFILN